MSFRSMIQEMKGEIGAISRHGVRSRSHRSGRVRRVAAVEPADALRQSCWEQLPPELLREVLVRIEESEMWWPRRRDVVACAGVCRSWRGIVKDIVRTPEASGKLTFPISLKQRNNLLAVRQYLETFPTLVEEQLIPIFHDNRMRQQALSSYVFIAANVILHSRELAAQINHLNQLLPPILPFLTSLFC